jgi:tetratricopeptide (TPR) repeat protein
MDTETSLDWLRRVPRTADELPAWLNAGHPHYIDTTTMGNAIKDSSRDACHHDLDLAEWLGRGLILFGEQEAQEGLIGLGEIALGDAIRLQGDYVTGLQILDRAAARFESIGDEVGWARTRIGWLGAVFHLESHPDVEPIVQRALQIFNTKEESRFLVPLFQNYAHYCIVKGRLLEALPLSEQALKVAEQIQDSSTRTQAVFTLLILLIQIHAELGQYEIAQAYLDQGSTQLQNHKLAPFLKVDFWSTASAFYFRTGRYTQSLYAIGQAKQLESRPDTLRVLEHREAQAYLFLNRLYECEEISLFWIEKLKDKPERAFGLASFLYLLAEVYRLSGRWEQATPISEQLLELLQRRDDPSLAWLHVAYRQYALVLSKSGKIQEAIHVARTAITLSEKVGEHTERVDTLLTASQIVLETTERDNFLAQALELAKTVAWLRWRVYQAIANTTTNGEARRFALLQATNDLDNVQSWLAASFHANYLIEALSLYESLIVDYLNTNEIECAWQTVERVKSRALMNTLMAQQEAPASVDSPLVAELKQLQLRHYELTRQVADGRVTYESVMPFLSEAETQIAKTQERIEIDHLGRREPLRVPPPFVPVAPPDSDLLGYFVMEDAIHLFLHNGEQYVHQKVDIGLSDLYGLMMAINTNISSVATAPNVFVPILLRQLQSNLNVLYRLLIAPIQPYLKHSKLVIVPHGVLHQLPFHLLWNGEQYLLQTSELRIVPTARLLGRTGDAPNRPIHHAVISDDWDGQLPNAEREGAGVAQILESTRHFHGVEAKKELVLTLLDSRGVLHIAAHGAHRPDHPELSHIQLSDGQLTLVDLFRHTIHKDLVTLSACETGMAVIRAGDDPVGLWRGFLAAGARSLLVALWQLEDAISEQLMTAYYKKLSQGVTRVCALREVQQEWLNKAEGRYLHPFYWGAYQLIGDDGSIPIQTVTE